MGSRMQWPADPPRTVIPHIHRGPGDDDPRRRHTDHGRRGRSDDHRGGRADRGRGNHGNRGNHPDRRRCDHHRRRCGDNDRSHWKRDANANVDLHRCMRNAEAAEPQQEHYFFHTMNQTESRPPCSSAEAILVFFFLNKFGPQTS